MIKVYLATKESRRSDTKRNRIILQIEGLYFHLSGSEALNIYRSFGKILSNRKVKK